MQVVLNGRQIPEEQARAAAVAPGLLYGDGCFETIRLAHGKPRFFDEHWQRFHEASQSIGLALDVTPETILEHALKLAHANGVADGVLRLSCHARNHGADWLILATPPRRHPLPTSYHIEISDWPHPGPHPLAAIKHNNYARFREPHRRARENGVDECLLGNAHHEAVEGAVSNLFWVDREGQICTPPLESGALPGVIRAKVLALYPAIIERPAPFHEIRRAPEMFLTNSLIEIMPVASLDHQTLPTCPGDLTRRVIANFRAAYPE